MATYQIVMTKGPTPGKFYDITGSIVSIGRDIGSDIIINISEVSRRHAHFRLDGGVYILEDLGSTNGTFVNGQRLNAPHRMRDGDTIMLGEAVTLFFKTSGPLDPNATLIASSSQVATMVARDQAEFPSSDPAGMYAQDIYAAPPPPVYSGNIPAGPLDFEAEAPSKGSNTKTWLFAGIGCVLILLLGCVAVAVLFDTMDMYCQPPFDSLFSFLYTCP